MIKIEELSIYHDKCGKRNQLVSDVSFEVALSASLAIVGESGSGKSLTALSLMGLLPAGITAKAKSMNFCEQNIVSMSSKSWCNLRGNEIAMVFQEPLSALNPLHTIEKQIKEAILVHRPNANWSVEINHLLEQVELSRAKHILKSYPHQLSGGQRQRVMIAMAIANQPKLLIADEPTTALDVMVQVQILKLLKKLQQEMNMGLILITHDLPIVKHLCDDILVMKNGCVEAYGNTDNFFKKPPTEYFRTLIKPYRAAPVNFESVADKCLHVERLGVDISQGHFWQKQQRAIIQNIRFDVLNGESMGIIGESGSGKTTLAMALCRLMPAKGEVFFLGSSWFKLGKKMLRQLRPNMQMVFQDPFSSLPPRLNVGDIIGEGILTRFKRHSVSWVEAVEQAMCDVNLNPKDRFRYPNEFSGGQRQRIAIARAIIMKPKLLILDEPTSALDQSIREQVLTLLINLQAEKKLTFIVITHDLRVIQALCHRVMVMSHGKIVEKNNVEELLLSPKHAYTKKLIQANLALVDGDILI